jgi:hypothetical protein
VRVELEELAGHLAEERDVRIGDVFAAPVNEEKLAPPESEEEAEHLHHELPSSFEWLEGPLENVTVEARDVAKAALFSAVAPVLDAKEAAKLKEA